MHIEPLQTPLRWFPDLPGSKSHANRALVLAALSNGPFRIEGATACDDVELMVRGLRTLGFQIDWADRANGVVEGIGGIPTTTPGGPVTVDCELAGTTLRFLCAVAALVPGHWVIDGNERMRRRPIGPLVDALRELGVEADAPTGCPPVTIRGGTATGSAVTVDASVSSQFVSALLLAGARWPGGLELKVRDGVLTSPGYTAITEQVLRAFGVELQSGGGSWAIEPSVPQTPEGFRVEADASAHAAWVALNFASSNLHGAWADDVPEGSEQRDWTIATRIADLAETGSRCFDLTEVPDQAMNLAVVAALRNGTTTFVGGANLRSKESDRIAATVAMLRAVGVEAHETMDGFIVRGGRRLKHGLIETHADHRLAIAGTLLGLLGEGVEIDDPSCVSKSYPSWFEDVAAARSQQMHVLLVGMRGAGKTTLGHALAERIGRPFVDMDERFEEQHGPISAFVQQHGWPEFRHIERALLHDTLNTEPRTPLVCAAGGGVVEGEHPLSPESTISIWVQESLDTLTTRVAASDRPSLTGRPPAEELPEVYARRAPLYAAAADLVSPPGLSLDQRLTLLLDALHP